MTPRDFMQKQAEHSSALFTYSLKFQESAEIFDAVNNYPKWIHFGVRDSWRMSVTFMKPVQDFVIQTAGAFFFQL